uniref:Glycosyl transferase family 1 domain-containing protein n=1 Tax=Chrysophaeum taylorii TaxID=2483200 RepID=A0AAD7XM23_9STRA|nr:hypothetical protein CTAYLR_006474 [Chrysophaeum taylorii]
MWALAVALAVAAAAVVQEAPFVLIAEPESGNIVYGHRPDDRNRHVVRVVLHFYDLHLISPEERAGLSVWFRIDRGQTVTLGPPLPASELEMSMRLGTHVIEVALRRDADIENDDDDVAIPRGVDPARVAVTVFDVMPEPGQEILRSRESPEAHLDRWWRPRADAYDYDRCLQSPMHVVLVGSLSLGGQAMLALEQARRLPGLRLSDGRPAFRLTYATSAPEGRPEPLRARLEALGVPVVRYAARIPYELACDLDGAPADNIGKRLATYASRDALPPALEAVVGKLLDIFMTADVVSFTNHETYTSADALIVECARLARVPHVLNEPANLWWGDLPTGTRKGGNGTLLAGLILPSEFAAQFWARRGVTVPLFVINPGVDVRRDDQVIAPRRRSRAFDNAMGTVVRVAFVGRLAPQKSPGLFVRAAASITALYSRHAPRKTSPRVRFVVIGDGPLRAAMEELARMLGLSVGSSDDADIEFLGWLPPEDVREAIRNYTDIVVHTNVLEETFCMCNIEAMAEDRYVISFGVGGVSEYLVQGDHHGTVVETPSVPALVAAIINVLENPNRAAAAGVMAARRVRGLDDGIDLSFERMARQYANLYAAFACQHSRQANHDGQEVETKRSSVSTPDTFADILNTLRKTHQVACLEHNRTGDTRAAWALSTLAAIAEAGLLAARKLVLSSKIPELARIAATARATRGGLLLQIAEEFQTRLSRIVRHKRLVQAWAYKYLYNGDKGIRPHADEGTVTINCWLTPDAENLDDTSGGLRVYLSETPSNFSFATANQDFRRVMAALGDAPFLDVPHRQNRCLVFKSRLVHETQPLNFRRTYESSRINLSLMYGSTSWQA